MQSCGDYIGQPIALSEKIYGGSAILTKQAECPFRAFANFRLNAIPLPEPLWASPPSNVEPCYILLLKKFGKFCKAKKSYNQWLR